MRALVLLFPFALSACAALPFARPAPVAESVVVHLPGPDTTRPMPRPQARAALGRAGGRDAATLDQTSAAERQAALAPAPARATALGDTLAALGSPTEQGFWLRTGLVSRVQPGRVTLPGGASVAVELRPSGQGPSAGSQLSLAAFRALDVPLTELVRLQVSVD